MTHFEKKVYTIVKKIPAGEVKTYAWVARKAGKPGAVRAVGNVLSKNIFPLIVPCHRVVNSTGAIGGYAFGRDLKRKLLETEDVFRNKGKIKSRRS